MAKGKRTAERRAQARFDWSAGGVRLRTQVGLALLAALTFAAITAVFLGEAQHERMIELIKELIRSVALLAAGAELANIRR